MENHHVDKTHKIIHKLNIADQIARVISIETATQDQTWTEIIFQSIVGIVFTRTLGTDTIPMTVQEIHLTIKTETILTIELESIQIIETEIIRY